MLGFNILFCIKKGLVLDFGHGIHFNIFLGQKVKNIQLSKFIDSNLDKSHMFIVLAIAHLV